MKKIPYKINKDKSLDIKMHILERRKVKIQSLNKIIAANQDKIITYLFE